MLILAISLESLCIAPPSAADSDTLEESWVTTVSVGVVSWGDLHNLQPAAGGRFDAIGLTLEGSLHKHLRSWGSADVLFGIDLAGFITESNVPGFYGDFSQRGMYLTPSVRLRYATGEKSHLSLKAGAGWYQVDFAELYCYGQCFEIQEADSADALGAYLGLGVGFADSLAADIKMHFANFGDVAGLGGNAGSLAGPIITVNIGWQFTN